MQRNQALVSTIFVLLKKRYTVFHWALSTTQYEDQRLRFKKISARFPLKNIKVA